MQPTENETTIAMTAAAKFVYDERRGMEMAQAQILLPTWEQLDPMVRNTLLDSVTHVVWAALVALPDRVDPWRQLMDETDPNDFRQLQHFYTLIKESLSGRTG